MAGESVGKTRRNFITRHDYRDNIGKISNRFPREFIWKLRGIRRKHAFREEDILINRKIRCLQISRDYCSICLRLLFVLYIDFSLSICLRQYLQKKYLRIGVNFFASFLPYTVSLKELQPTEQFNRCNRFADR